MAIVLNNAMLVDLDPIRVERGSLRIDGQRIVERAAQVTTRAGDEVVDCDGAVVMPGLVNGHAHLYSALATGMPTPSAAPSNFREILEYVWWRLDRALDAESIEVSGRIGALDALHSGTTTLIDHHASPSCIEGSLDRIEKGVADVGLRVVVCYETTDRNGRAGREAGVEENRRYLAKHRSQPSEQFAGLVGGHAAFTLEDETLDELAGLAETFATGIHIHVAEDPCDDETCRREHGASLIDRLADHGILRPASILAHGTHLSREAIARVSDASVTLAHNPRSNMNNAVGYTAVAAFRCPVILGTDGIGSDMFTEAKHAWFKSRDGHAGISPNDVVGMLAASARRASESLGVTLGRLEVNAAADVVITDYRPATPLTAENVAGHLLFGMGPQYVKDVIINGVWALRDRAVVACDEPAVRRGAVAVASTLWAKMASLDR
jgi:putative selenium metabolism protein SsnA